MRLAMISALALATAAGPALSQEFRLIPRGPASDGGQEYILLMIPGNQSDQSDATSRQSGSQSQTGSRSDSSDAQSRGSSRDYARQIYRRGYEHGRQTASGDNVSESDLREFGRRYFARGYARGRLDERAGDERAGDAGQSAGLSDDDLSRLRQAIRQARQAMWNEDYREARRAMRRAEILMPETPAADPDGPRSRGDMVPGGQPERNFLPSVRRPGIRQDGDQARSRDGGQTEDRDRNRDSAQMRHESRRNDRDQTGSTPQPEIADHAPPGTVSGELPIDIPRSDDSRRKQGR